MKTNVTLAEIDGSIPKDSLVSFTNSDNLNSCYVTNNNFGNSIVCDRFDTGTIAGQLPGYHTTRPAYNIINGRFALMEKHKVYKKFSSLMNNYRKNKKEYEINVHDYFVMGSDIIQIKLDTPISISFINKKTNSQEKICKLGDYSNDVLSSCVAKFLDEHSEEFMELIEEELKKDMKEFAKQESKRMKESMELVDIIQDIE